MKWILAIIGTGVLALTAACAGAPARDGGLATTPAPSVTTGPEETALPGATQPPVDEEGPQETTAPSPTRPDMPPASPTGGPPLPEGAVPLEIFNSIMADAVERTGADPSRFELVRNQAVVWNDGSLGCPKPGEFYTQALAPGYWVVLSYRGQRLDYRASDRGHFFLCEGALVPEPGPPGGGGTGQPLE